MLFTGHSSSSASASRQHPPRIMNVETASGGRCSALEITIPGGSNSSSGIRNGSYFHTNTYRHLPGIKQDTRADSTRRMARAASLPSPANAQQTRALLGDGVDVQYPIYMHSTGGEAGAYTLHSTVFNGMDRTCTVYHGNPAGGRALYRYHL